MLGLSGDATGVLHVLSGQTVNFPSSMATSLVANLGSTLNLPSVITMTGMFVVSFDCLVLKVC